MPQLETTLDDDLEKMFQASLRMKRKVLSTHDRTKLKKILRSLSQTDACYRAVARRHKFDPLKEANIS